MHIFSYHHGELYIYHVWLFIIFFVIFAAALSTTNYFKD